MFEKYLNVDHVVEVVRVSIRVYVYFRVHDDGGLRKHFFQNSGVVGQPFGVVV